MELSPLERTVAYAPILDIGNCKEPEVIRRIVPTALTYLDSEERDVLALISAFDFRVKPEQPDDLRQYDLAVREAKTAYERNRPDRFHKLRSHFARLRNRNPITTVLNSSGGYIIYEQNASIISAGDLTFAGTLYGGQHTANTIVATACMANSITVQVSDDGVQFTNCSLLSNQTSILNPTNTYVIRNPSWESTSPFTGFRPLLQASERAATLFSRKVNVPQSQRRIINRQIQLLDSVLDGEGNTQMFLSGQTLTVASGTTGLRYRFSTSKGKHTLARMNEHNGHATPFDLEILNSEGVYLSKICVYVRGTPMLDQLAAFIMYIRSGEDLSLLEKGNYFSIGDSVKLNTELARLGLLHKRVSVRPPVVHNDSVPTTIRSDPMQSPYEEDDPRKYAPTELLEILDDYYLLKAISQGR